MRQGECQAEPEREGAKAFREERAQETIAAPMAEPGRREKAVPSGEQAVSAGPSPQGTDAPGHGAACRGQGASAMSESAIGDSWAGQPDVEGDQAEAAQGSAPDPKVFTAQGLPHGAFSLSKPPETVLPQALQSAADGRLYPIDPDFRTVLACLRRLADPNRDPLQKRLYLAARFFLGHPPADLDALFARFVTGDAPPRAGEPPLFDLERDAGAIYASFRQQYGIDLLKEALHWVAFRELLAGLMEATPFGARVRLRAVDENRLPPEQRPALRRAKAQVALTPPVSREEQTLLRELDRRLAAGEDPADLLEKLQEV